jgi:hypothetical protein
MRLQLDSTSNNIQRRYLTDLAEYAPETVISAHLFTDASPVTGAELQGMLLQVMLRLQPMLQIVMPGVHLPFGYTAVASTV